MAPDCNRGIPASRRFLALCLLMLAILQAQAADLTLFDDQLQNGFQDWSWQPGGDGETDVDMALATPVHSGSKAIDYRAHDWNGLSFAHPTLDFATTDHPQLRFYVRGAAGDEQLTLVLQKDGGVAGSAALDGFIVGGGIASGAWREVRVDLREPPLSILGSIDRVDLQDATGVAGHANAQRVFIDDVQLLAPPPSEPAIFADSFEGGVGNVAPVAAADSYSVAKGGTLAPTAPGVLGNDNDANGDPLSAVLVSGPAHAAAFNLNANGSFSYTHDDGADAADGFSYRASDGSAQSAPVTVSLAIQAPAASTPWVDGYYVGYEKDLYPVADLDFTAITHLMVGRLIPNSNGTLTTHFDIDGVNGPIFAQDAINAAHAAGRTAIFMVGGAGELAGWRGAASNANRAAFVTNLLAAVDSYGADGLDLDWEPVDAIDRAPLLALANDLRTARPNLLLTMPVPGINTNFPPNDEATFFASLHPLLDQINVMSYDMAQDYNGWDSWFSSALHGEYGNAPMSVSSSVDYYQGLGIPAAKLGLGIGFYGACFNGISQPRQPAEGLLVASDGAMSYANIANSYLPLMTRTYDATADAPWLGSATPKGPQGCTYVSYEDAESIAAKGAYADAQGLGGTIIWTIAQGHRAGQVPPDPLLDAVGDAFLGDGVPAATLQIEQDVTVDSMLSDRFTWIDASGQPRSASLAHNDTAAGPGGSRGGAMRQFTYRLPGGATRTAGVTNYGNGGYGGFGYVVSHSAWPDNGGGCRADDSPLGFKIPGTFERVFQGRHHAIFRFRQDYPRNCAQVTPVASIPLPVTIDWVFSTGRDNPLWSITFDMAQPGKEIAVDTLLDDSRAPYGELEFDGAGVQNLSGIAWGDRWKFTTTSTPLTLNSHWSWNVPNSVPYVEEWIDATDASMGLVQSRTMTQQDAGARNQWYNDITAYWNKTSADGNAGGAYRMPWNDSWPYQAAEFSLDPGTPNTGTNNARLTWGTSYGFIGQASYDVYDGVIATAPGHPRKSYAVYIVLGTHSSAPVAAQVTQIETLQTLTLSATVGGVVTAGPRGVADSTAMTYEPAGYDPVYGALAFTASGNQLDATIQVGAGTLTHPLIVLRGYTAATPPSLVRLGDTALTADIDYFASVRDDADELWITLDRDLTGAGNRLRVDP